MKVKEGKDYAGDNWRIWLIASYGIIILLLALLWIFSMIVPISETEEEQQYESLEAIADTGVTLLEDSDVDAQQAVDSMGGDGNIRATLIAADGSVLADSVDDVATMENHSQRPEIITALEGGVGRDRRESATDGIEYLYLAEAATFNGAQVVLRVSVPASEVTAFTETFEASTSVALLITILISVLVAILAFRRTTAPVSHLERVRTNFVANASHELKTPVAGIRLLSESIEQASEDGDIEHIKVFSQRLSKESLRLQTLVTELLDLSRLENEDLPSRSPKTADLVNVVSTSYEGHLMQAKAKGIDFVLDDRIGPDERAQVKLSPADASLIADNLIENAINYTQEGTVTVRLTPSGRNFVLEVADTGIGIPAADQERIFERFYRVDTARSREMGGTGLGLSLVRHAVNRAGGTLRLKSTEGVGSTFTVTLPRA